MCFSCEMTVPIGGKSNCKRGDNGMVKEDSSEILQKVYSAQDNDDLKKAYDQWAPK